MVWKFVKQFGLISCICAGAWSLHAVAAPAQASGVKVETLLQTSNSWNGAAYVAYPQGTPEVRVVKYSIPAKTSLAWHSHPMINAAYVVSGTLTVVEKESGRSFSVGPGKVLPETVNTVHRGYSDDAPVELIVFYAGAQGEPMSIAEQ